MTQLFNRNTPYNMALSTEVDRRIRILKAIPIFRNLETTLLQEIATTLTKKKVSKGTTLFSKGDKDYSLYIIAEGEVKIHDEEHIFTTFTKNQFFGEYALVDSTPRSASATAVKDSKLLELSQDVFNRLLSTKTEMSAAMLQSLILRLRDYNKLEAELTKKNIEIEKQKRALEDQRKELEGLNSTKDKFFAIIAHDLKNPFSTVLGLSELLAKEFETFDSKSLKQFISLIYKYSNNTFNLLENLLQWSMVQTGRMPLRPHFGDLKGMIDENIELLSGNIKNKNIKVESLVYTEHLAYMDSNQITTVIRNLISNAIKFTPNDGHISITIKDDDEFWRVAVCDTGIGIDKKDIKKLFLIDSNPTTIGTSEEKGTGLGLILCKEFVERNGGKIWVDSTLNKGSTFYFTVPKTEPIGN